jgi:hypothetical protein
MTLCITIAARSSIQFAFISACGAQSCFIRMLLSRISLQITTRSAGKRQTQAFPSKRVDPGPPTSSRLAAAPMLLLNPITANAHHHLATEATNMLFITVVAKLVGRRRRCLASFSTSKARLTTRGTNVGPFFCLECRCSWFLFVDVSE